MSHSSTALAGSASQTASPALDQERQAWIEGLEGQLLSAGASFSEQAFSIGCSAATIPAALILLFTFLLGNRSWTGLFIAGLIILLLALALVNVFALRARNGAVQRAYQQNILPQIQAYLDENQLTLGGFQQAASQALPQEALLIKFLSATPVANQPAIGVPLAKE